MKKDTLVIAPQGDIETSIIYSAKDSIIMNVANKIVYLYGEASVDYGDISLTAAEIEINWATNIMTARPAIDSTGKKTGIPLFKDGEDLYLVENYASYNFKTRKGISSGVITQQGEGFIHGETIKKVNENLYISEAHYTTCNLADPHFYIKAKKLKVIPEDKIVSGPFNMVISDVPTPFGFILGYFPIPKREKSGIIFPTGGSSTRGFFLREGGYYWAVNDYVGLKLLGDAYTNGSFRASFLGEYRKRYAFSGNLSFSYSKNKVGFDEEEGSNRDINVRWTHSTLRQKNSSLTANVNAGSSTYYKTNTLNPTVFQTGVLSSSILYYKTFANTPFNLSLALRQDQNITTRVMNFTLPEATFSMNRIYPFKRRNAVGPKRLYENINIGYTLNTKVFFTNDSIRLGTDTVFAFNRENLPFLLSKAEYGAKHNIPISTTFKPNKTFLKYFNFTPNILYEEFWYPYKLDYEWNPADNVLERDTIWGFSRTSSYSGSMNLSTTIYGLYKFNSKKLLGIRHTLIPGVGYSFKPDFTKGNYQEVQINVQGTRQELSRYAGFIYGGPSQGVNSNLTFNIMNSLEAKVATKNDSIADTKKIKLLEELSLRGFYNFAAERNPLSQITGTARTRILDRFDILGSATFDPYTLDTLTGLRSEEFTIRNKQGLARLVNYNIFIGANLNPRARQTYKSDKATDQKSQEELRFINAFPEAYVDFSLPWTLYVSYNLSYLKPGLLPATTTQSLTFYGDIRLTDKWKVGFNSGYDFLLNTLTTTRIDIYRDLHCWQMSLNLSPFGPLRFYGFTIHAKSSILQDLRLNKKSPTYYGSFY